MNLTPKQRESLRMKYGGHCAYCGTVLTSKWHADHLKPVVRTGKWVPNGHRRMKYQMTGQLEHPEHDHIDNMMPSCVPCNIHKGDMKLEAWRSYLQRMLTNLRSYSGVYRHAIRFGLVVEQPQVVVFYFERTRERKRIQLRAA